MTDTRDLRQTEAATTLLSFAKLPPVWAKPHSSLIKTYLFVTDEEGTVLCQQPEWVQTGHGHLHIKIEAVN